MAGWLVGSLDIEIKIEKAYMIATVKDSETGGNLNK